jgi:hypothetical protein
VVISSPILPFSAELEGVRVSVLLSLVVQLEISVAFGGPSSHMLLALSKSAATGATGVCKITKLCRVPSRIGNFLFARRDAIPLP